MNFRSFLLPLALVAVALSCQPANPEPAQNLDNSQQEQSQPAGPEVVAVTEITLDQASLSLEVGKEARLTATVKPDKASDKTVTWSSADPTVADVDQQGKVSALKEGSAAITATAGGKSAVCQVTVTAPYVPFSLTPSEVELEAGGGTFTVTVTCSTEYHISSQPDWVEEVSAADHVHTFSVPANSSQDGRSGVIVFCDDKGTCLPCQVKQEGGFDWSQTFSHRSLMMRFTATWCGYCPRMAKSVHLAQEQHPGKIETLNLHGGQSALEFSGTTKLMNRYSIDGFPTGVVDGRRLVENYETSYTAQLIGQYVEETEQYYPVSTGISYESSWNGRALDLDVALYLRQAGDYKVTVLLLEDGIVGYQADYDEGSHNDYVHDSVARMVLTDVAGDAFKVEQNLSVKHFRYSVNVPAAYNQSNLRVLVYVQMAFGSRAVRQTSGYGKFYVDNCASGVAGGSLAPTVE